MKASSSLHTMIFEPRTEGHHLSWLHYITEDLLSVGFKLTLAVDNNPKAKTLIREQFSTLMENVDIIPVFDQSGKYRYGNKLKTIACCMEKSGAEEVFLPNLDEITSNCLRFAALGIYPPRILKGSLSGVYHRPRSLKEPYWPLGNLIKTVGFYQLTKQCWFKNIYLVDEYLTKKVKNQYPNTIIHFIPDPGCGDFSHTKEDAREVLGIPNDKFVFLNYGIPAKRKGLHIAVKTMVDISPESRFFLLCAGRIVRDPEVLNNLEKLKERGNAITMDRYISDLEEKLCFCASDVVLLPYIKHFGSSAILSRAVAAGKMIIASDEGLIGKRVKEHKLGLLFESENTHELGEAIKKAALLTENEKSIFKESISKYAKLCSREAFRSALLQPYNV